MASCASSARASSGWKTHEIPHRRGHYRWPGALGVWQLYQFLEKIQETAAARILRPVLAGARGDQLPGLPPKLEPALEAARRQGAAGLRDFLAANGKNVADPRLAWIELDYVLVVAPGDPAEARKVFAASQRSDSSPTPPFTPG